MMGILDSDTSEVFIAIKAEGEILNGGNELSRATGCGRFIVNGQENCDCTNREKLQILLTLAFETWGIFYPSPRISSKSCLS